MLEKLRGVFQNIKNSISSAVLEKKLDEKTLDDIFDEFELLLIEADVALPVIEALRNNLKKKLLGLNVPRKAVEETVTRALEETLLEILNKNKINFDHEVLNGPRPYVILFLGVNGSGKTTTIAKIAYRLKNMGLDPVIAASDTFRAGAIEQLKKHCDSLGVKLIYQDYGADPAAVAYDAIQHAKARGKDVVLIDTAGRMQTNRNLMEEMKKIKRVSNPHMTIFVGDALTGNDAIIQAREFYTNVGFDAVILTKMDADAKGGAAITISYETGRPVIFIGTGQSYNDLMPFDPKEFVGKLLH
ncbi:MAG: signal recognition particle-docking protein FtsY [Euryarchaeota archaeon]|nr:signal recognition particle-docking protein FtsY [Euryarchaeota archaeon]